MKILFFDTETTGIIIKGGSLEQQPYVIQFGGIIIEYDIFFNKINEVKINHLFNPGVFIPEQSSNIHHITNDMVLFKEKISVFLKEFIDIIKSCDYIVGFNIDFDINVMLYEIERFYGFKNFQNGTQELFFNELEKFKKLIRGKSICIMLNSIDLLKIPGKYGKYKWPKLIEVYNYLFKQNFDGAHDAMSDIIATEACFNELINKKIICL